jgi:uncharacterized protein YceK
MKAFRLLFVVAALAALCSGCSTVEGERAADRSRQSPVAQTAQLSSSEPGWTLALPGDNL